MASYLHLQLGINKIALRNCCVLFSIYERNMLENWETRYLSRIEEELEVDNILYDISNVPLRVSMVWTLYERCRYMDILEDCFELDYLDLTEAFFCLLSIWFREHLGIWLAKQKFYP
ncbi:hypothetical protein MOSE0_A05050 [Monosporozyma servazzii]